MVEHHVTGLEVAIEEAVNDRRLQVSFNEILISREVLCEKAEVSLQLQLVEVELSSFQETILEIVEIEEHAVDIKFRLRIAVGEIEAPGTTHLDIRQFTDGTAQQFLLLERIASSCLTATTNGIEE